VSETTTRNTRSGGLQAAVAALVALAAAPARADTLNYFEPQR
jgi:hypothetical protein